MNRLLKILIHTIYWFVFSAFSFFMGSNCTASWDYIRNFSPHFFINLGWAVIVFYLFYFYFIRFFKKQYLGKYLFYSFLTSIALTLIMLPLHRFFYPAFDVFDYRYWLPPMAGTFIIAQCGSLVRGFENWFAEMQIKSEQENRNLKNELELLRSQINPHFLFNALNNIDSLIHSHPEKASESLVSLSSMMRYMIYETGTDAVPLEKELEYIRNYIALQQIRYKEKETIRVSLPSACSGIRVAPMILIPFIENAFKHAHRAGKLPVIDIALECSENTILFRCRNYFDASQKSMPSAGGFGLDNARKRLALLYPGTHELLIFEKDSQFNVELKIHRS